MIDWEPLAKQLAEAVAAGGELLNSAWRQAFQQTPRHLFVPRFWELGKYNVPETLIEGVNPASRQQWLTACYTNRVLITRWSDQNGRRILTSSASLPSLVAHMLHALDVRDGHRVLEIGTGSGWNAGLLCHRLGAGQVVTVDIDAVIAAEAQAHLQQLGHQPTVVATDGTVGYPHGAPYDRILCTASAGPVPAAWIDQLTDDGLIVAPLTLGGALAVLRKTGPAEVSGRLDPEQAYFMPLHAAGEPMPTGFVVDKPQHRDTDPVFRSTSDVDLAAWADPDFRLWLALHLPEGHLADLVDEQLNRTGVVVYTAINRATVDYQAGEPGAWPATQDGARLWNTVEAAWRSWRRNGQPSRTRLGVTARTGGEQYAWLDDPDGPHRWPMPS